MTQERWQEVKAILASALERAPEERRVYLDEACTEPALRREVQSLIDAHEQAETTFMGKPLVGTDEILRSGAKLGPYEILARIGAGGMGVVYRARDTRLEREVAIKVLAVGLLTDEAARKRFRKEALALAKLNHPNIATVHDVGEQGGTDYLVMECVPGLSLAEKLKSGALSEKEVSSLGAQIAAALEEAHEQGIIHRDLKPANVMVTPKGLAKVLDFGLAKLLLPFSDVATTQSFAESKALVGTLPYMAPEQLQGEAVDARTDIHALGLVLYEMASGRRLFQQDSIPQLTDAILHQPPVTPRAFNARVSPELERIILKCLEKEPENRYQSAKDLGVDLRRISAPATSTSPVATEPAAKSLRSWWAAAISTVLVIGLVVAGSLVFTHKAHVLTDKDTIVVADFTNTSGDPVFDGALRQGLSIQLEQSPFLSLVSDDRIQRTLQFMEKPHANLTPEIAEEICQRTASAAVLEGSIAQIGTQYLLTLNAVGCSGGKSLASTEATANDKNHVLDALGKIASDIRNKLGESLSTVQKFDTPLEQATTPSLEALQAYSFGRRAMSARGDWSAALPFFQRAISLDPNFAIAYARLGMSYRNIGEATLGAQKVQEAYQLRDQVSEPEKFYIESHYYHIAVADLEKTRQVCDLWVQTYPRDFTPHADLADIYFMIGQYDKALAEAREVVRLDANSVGYSEVVGSDLSLNRVQEARSTAKEMQAKKFDSPTLHFLLYQLAFLRNDAAEMAQQVAWAAGKPGAEDALLGLEADTEAYFGHLQRSRALSRSAVESALQAKKMEVAATYEAAAALREAVFGNAAEARQRAAAAFHQSNGRDIEYGAALALAFAGDARRARTLAEDLAKRFPEDTLVRFNYLPTIRAHLALSADNSFEALKALEIAEPYELGHGQPGLPSATALSPVYVRAETYLAAHQGTEAAAEFRKILAHPGIGVNEPTSPLARLGLARAYAIQGDAASAKLAYQDFFALWKEADPDIPVFKQAKAEYAKLENSTPNQPSKDARK